MLSPPELLHSWCRQCLLKRPPGLYPAEQGPAVQAKPFSPVFNSQSLPVKLEPSLVLSVFSLFKGGLPPTVPWLVVPEIHLPPKLVRGRWSSPESLQKAGKSCGSSPLVAHHNSLRPIIGKPVVFRIMASLYHAIPNNPFGRSCLAVSGSSLSFRGGDLALKAPAAISVPSQISRDRLMGGPTIAQAEPLQRFRPRHYVFSGRPSKTYIF